MALVLTWPVGRDADDEPARDAAPAGPVLSHLFGCVLGGTLTGLAVGATVAILRSLPSPERVQLALAAALLVAAVVAEARGQVAPLPERRGQVPRGWLTWPSRTRTGFAFGLLIGSGVATYLKHAAGYALVALALVAPSVAAAVLVGTVYGAARGGTVVATWVGDRFAGRRLPLAPVEERHLPLNMALAALAVVSFGVAAVPIVV